MDQYVVVTSGEYILGVYRGAEKMTKKQAVHCFTECILPIVKARYEKSGRRDLGARREAWNDYTDMLCKDGQITDHQYDTWTQPRICQ